tara:strand:+ start:5106 stop:5315 length:210 start_codon:yes stop_codon:yes gene_type:complete
MVAIFLRPKKMGNCRSTLIEVIPDRETMIAAVDAIEQIELALKKGQPVEKKKLKQVQQLTKALRSLPSQ